MTIFLYHQRQSFYSGMTVAYLVKQSGCRLMLSTLSVLISPLLISTVSLLEHIFRVFVFANPCIQIILPVLTIFSKLMLKMYRTPIIIV